LGPLSNAKQGKQYNKLFDVSLFYYKVKYKETTL